MEPDDTDEQQLQRHINSSEHQSISSSHEAAHAVLAEHFGYRVIHVSTAGRIVPAGSPEAKLVGDGELGAIGGSVEIDWGRVDPNAPDFDECLQDIATIEMGGRAAEELRHPESALPSHWKYDEAHFKEPLKKYRTEAQMNDLLKEGCKRAKALLSTPQIAIQHQRVRDCLIAGLYRNRPNGNSIRRAMKGLHEQQ